MNTPLGGAGTRAHEGQWTRTIAVQVIASVVLLQTLTIVWGEEAAIPSDDKFVDELVSELGFQPSDLIERVRQLANMPSEASEAGDAIATASVGSEGAIGTIAGTGFVRAFTRAMVQAPGVASRIAVSHLRRAVSKSETINDLLTHYHMALMCQVQQTSLCNSVHDATSRLSRLLLLLSEQAKDDTISFSQERLAYMLGLRRSSVTVVAQALQSRRFIRYRRGRIEIVNRKGLQAAACECYEIVSRTFDQFLEDKQVTRQTRHAI